MAGFRELQQAIDRFLWVYTYISQSLKHISYIFFHNFFILFFSVI